MAHRAVYKSKSVEVLDTFYVDGPAAALQFGGGVLADPDADAQGVASTWAASPGAVDAGFDPDELVGFQEKWLAEDGPLGEHEVDRVIRLANREAIAIADAHQPKVPIETFWVRGAGEDFEVHVHDGVERVTVFWFVPLERDYGSTKTQTSSWVIRVGNLDDVDADAPRVPLDDEPDPVLMIQVSGPLPGDSAAS